MPSSDLVLNVRQLAGYDQTGQALTTDSVLLQRGLGGPYLSISPAAFVSTALMSGGDMVVGGQVSALAIQAGSGQYSNLAAGILTAQQACLTEFDAQWGSIQGVPLATQNDIAAVMTAWRTSTVLSFNGRQGDVRLSWNDVWCVGGAPIFSPRFEGYPRAETPAPWSNNTRLATTGFVHRNTVEYISNLLRDHPFVFSFNGRTGDVTLQASDIEGAEAALLNSPQLVGTPTAPTAAAGDSSTLIATTEFVSSAIAASETGLAAIYAPIDSPAFTGVPTALTANPGTATAQLATTAFVMNAVAASTAGVVSFNTRTGIVTLAAADITGAGGALLNSPVFTGDVQAPTVAAGDNSNHIATTAWVLNELGGANIGVMSFNGRAGVITLNTSDITSAGGAPAASPTFTGTPQAPTAATGTSTDQLATTAFVMSAVTAGAGVTSFMGRAGAITLNQGDISAAGGAVLASPAFTGHPAAPTQPAGTNNTDIATTAFVTAAITAAQGVSSFNGRGGAVTLTSADVNATTAGGPYLAKAGGTMTGVLTLAGNAVNPLDAMPLRQLSNVTNGAASPVLVASSATVSALIPGSWRVVALDGGASTDTQGGWGQPGAYSYRPRVPGVYLFWARTSGGSSAGNTNGTALILNAANFTTTPNLTGTPLGYMAASQLSGVVMTGIWYMNGTTDHVSIWATSGNNNPASSVAAYSPALIAWLLFPTI